MIAYNKTGLKHVRVLHVISSYLKKGLISSEEFLKIKEAYTSPFYTPNLFIRIGFFILTCCISGFGAGLLSLLAADSGIIATCGWFIFIAFLNYIALEILIRQNHYYKAGIDDALLWISGGLLTGALIVLVNDYLEGDPVVISIVVFLVAALFTIRFIDRLAAILAYLAALCFVFFIWKKIGELGLLTAPLVLMIASAAVYRACEKLKAQSACYDYAGCLEAIQWITLLTFYLSGNYYVVKELRDTLYGTVSGTIPFAWFFWSWTLILPLAYVAFGIVQKKTSFIRTGLLLVAAAVFTFRNYYQVLAIESALTAGGFLLTGISWFLIRFLSIPKAGFTSREPLDKSVKSEDELNAESLIVSETFSDQIKSPGEHLFGGGKFGGGGSNGSY